MANKNRKKNLSTRSTTCAPEENILSSEPLSFDEIVDKALKLCKKLPDSCSAFRIQIGELRNRLAEGQLHLAVLGQFNRGKSTFINALLGINILPTSVLPITAAQTNIRYDTKNSCTIHFLNQKPDLKVTDSLKSIRQTLKKYVTEENNSNNRYGVKNVTITCDSPLLANGTVLVDTPGFGSTYIHNTRTTLDLLAECDAALFLISADPPMTQTEVEFLKQVSLYVPQIFFILNKIDLVSPTEAKELHSFIKSILIKQLNYQYDTPIFHTCALKGVKAKHCSDTDPNWVASGLDSVKKEVLGFMSREKYFTLSEGLNDKFAEALHGIEHRISEELELHKAPINKRNEEKKRAKEILESIKSRIDKELDIFDIEKNALQNYLDEQITNSLPRIDQEIYQSIANTVNTTPRISNATAILSAMTTTTLKNAFERLYLKLISSANTHLRKAIDSHQSEYAMIHSLALNRSATKEQYDFTEIDIESSTDDTLFQTSDIPLPSLGKFALFSSRKKQKDTIQHYFNELAKKQIGIMAEKIRENSKLMITQSVSDLKTHFSKKYEKVITILEETAFKETTSPQETEAEARRIKELENILESLFEIRGELAS
ncbi:dynamin family protein [Chitinispirillales bacterium ANBcel5]|uniref:dynamin family protein n=1 Tax=Cellulosispirillum alkaliphilum TaxID=3039283 RepID=UPI002A54023C|nr:dynamin family protein [Chitinispirillales bacterium ANBcel5]